MLHYLPWGKAPYLASKGTIPTRITDANIQIFTKNHHLHEASISRFGKLTHLDKSEHSGDGFFGLLDALLVNGRLPDLLPLVLSLPSPVIVRIEGC